MDIWSIAYILRQTLSQAEARRRQPAAGDGKDMAFEEMGAQGQAIDDIAWAGAGG